MEKFTGAWQFERAERFDEFMVACGVSVLMRTMAAQMKPMMIFKVEEDGQISITISTAFSINKTTFKLGEEFDFTEPLTNIVVKATVTIEDGKLVQKQINPADQKEVKVVRDVIDGKLQQKMYVDAIVCTRYFTRVSEDPSTPAPPFEP